MPRRFAPMARMTPGQARTVAAWRLDDAFCLCRSRLAKHMNGAVYLGGIALECLLKARLLEKRPHLASADPTKLVPTDRRCWDLVYRSHSLDGLIAELPDVVAELQEASTPPWPRRDVLLRQAASRWSIHVRYWPKRIHPAEATEFLGQIEELKLCL